jgi:ADP-ribose pyrophosphatase YjhB (NUDIX family)
MQRRVSVRAIIFLDDKLLAVQLKPYKNSIVLEEPYWCTIGGGLEPGEAIIPGLQREVLEETGIMPKIGNLLYIQQFIHAEKEQMELFFHITNPSDFIIIDLSNASHAAEEIEKIEFISPAENNILPRFLTTETIGKQISSQEPPKIFSSI